MSLQCDTEHFTENIYVAYGQKTGRLGGVFVDFHVQFLLIAGERNCVKTPTSNNTSYQSRKKTGLRRFSFVQ